MKPILPILAITMATAGGCRSAHTTTADATPEQPAATVAAPLAAPSGEPMHRALPKAVIYKTNGDYRDNVPVTLNAAGTAVVSFPAPTDLSDLSTPLPLADGFLLDRRGVTADTRFLRCTYAEYRALPFAPTPAEILADVIPGSRVTALHRLDITLQQALGDTAAVNALIARDFR